MGHESCWGKSFIGRTLAFALCEMGSHWRVLSPRITYVFTVLCYTGSCAENKLKEGWAAQSGSKGVNEEAIAITRVRGNGQVRQRREMIRWIVFRLLFIYAFFYLFYGIIMI